MLKYAALQILSLVVFAASAPSQGRLATSNPLQVQSMSNFATNSVFSNDQRLQQAQAARLFVERQAQLRVDTAKLLALTTELKQQVDKTGINILSMDVIKKAQEIQKLAKSVQDKMKNGY